MDQKTFDFLAKQIVERNSIESKEAAFKAGYLYLIRELRNYIESSGDGLEILDNLEYLAYQNLQYE